MGLCVTVFSLGIYPSIQIIGIGLAVIFAMCVGAIIISDCLCQQWLDRTHKVTNPIKLITQVLNYARKHSYPERRSAFTYIDEKSPYEWTMGRTNSVDPSLRKR